MVCMSSTLCTLKTVLLRWFAFKVAVTLDSYVLREVLFRFMKIMLRGRGQYCIDSLIAFHYIRNIPRSLYTVV